MTSPRRIPPMRYVNLLTRIRSPICSVGSIEPEGMKNACTTKVMINRLSSAAKMLASSVSTTEERQAGGIA